jgi:hypothetical protein
VAIDDARAVEVVWRNLNPYPVSGQDSDPKASHLPGDVTKDNMSVIQLDAEHRIWESFNHFALELNLLFFSQIT